MSELLTNDLTLQKKEKKFYPVIYPIVTSSTYKIESIDKLINEPYTYSRSDNPTRKLLEKNLALLENAKHALSFSSGLGVLTCLSYLDIMKKGVICSHDLYGGTKRFFHKVWNRPVIEIDFNRQNNDEIQMILEKTAIQTIWIETPSNPLLEVLDLKKIVEMAKKYGKKVIVDNTFLSPIFQNPLELGVDIVTHSITKYINGMTDVVMGCLMTNSQLYYDKLKYLQNATGVITSPFDCYLVNRSIKTLKLRMKEHQSNAQILVERLDSHPEVSKVLYPKLIEGQMKGTGGMISFYLKGDYKEFFNHLQHIPIAESLGGIETLIEHPATMTHACLLKEERQRLGITNNLVRLSVGLEEADDIYYDLDQALKATVII